MSKATDTLYKKAEAQFFNLAGVDTDASRMGTIDALVYIAQFELDLAASGSSELLPNELRDIRTFVQRWS